MSGWRLRNKKREEQMMGIENKNRKRDGGQEVHISRKKWSAAGRENRHRGEDKAIEERDRVERGRGDMGISFD